MKRLLIASAVLATMMFGVAPAAQADWIAAAANSHGSGYGEDSSEDGAKSLALDDCESNTGYTCSWTKKNTASVPSHWYLVVVRCRSGRYAVAGSQHSYEQALENAANKAGGRRCRITERY